jgi:cyclase
MRKRCQHSGLGITKLAEGVFAVIPVDADEMASKGLPIATTSGFVIGTKAVLVIGSTLNQCLHEKLFKLISAETNLPVRSMVNTTFHGDHSYGNFYLPEEVSIIQHAIAKAYIEFHFEADKAFMMQNFGQGRGI